MISEVVVERLTNDDAVAAIGGFSTRLLMGTTACLLDLNSWVVWHSGMCSTCAWWSFIRFGCTSESEWTGIFSSVQAFFTCRYAAGLCSVI